MEKQIAKIPRVRQRREAVLDMLLTGWSRSEITKHIKIDWGAGQKTVDKDIEICYKHIGLAHNTEYSELVSRHVSSYYKLYNQAEDLGDTRSAIQALQAIEKLLKYVGADSQVFVQNNNYNFEQLTEPQIRKLLEEYDEDE